MRLIRITDKSVVKGSARSGNPYQVPPFSYSGQVTDGDQSPLWFPTKRIKLEYAQISASFPAGTGAGSGAFEILSNAAPRKEIGVDHNVADNVLTTIILPEGEKYALQYFGQTFLDNSHWIAVRCVGAPAGLEGVTINIIATEVLLGTTYQHS